MVKRLLLCLLLLSVTVLATDKTPSNKLMLFGTFSNPDSSITWYVERFNGLTHFRVVSPVIVDSMVDSADALGLEFMAGPYLSDHEVSAYVRSGEAYAYNYRLTLTNIIPYYILLREYLIDSAGISEDSCCLHFADTLYTTSNDGSPADKLTRTVHNDGSSYRRSRVSYQYFNNTSSDTAFYPAGYQWYINGKNADTRKAALYAYRKRFWDNTWRTTIDGGLYGPWRYVYMDNQYRDHALGGSYWTITSTSGGPTSGPDFVEGYNNINPDEGSPYTMNDLYFDENVRTTDSVIKFGLDSIAAADGRDSINTFANVDWDDPYDCYSLWPVVAGIFLEGPWQPDRSAGHFNRQRILFDSAAVLAPDLKICIYGIPTPFAVTLGSMDRAIMAHFCYYKVLDNGQVYWMAESSPDPATYWRDIYYVNTGTPIEDTVKTLYTGGTGWYGGTPYNWVWGRKGFNAGDTTYFLFRTSAGSSYNYQTDSVKVKLFSGTDTSWYYEIDINADTSATPVCSTWMKPYQGKLFTQGAGSEQPPTIGAILPASGYRDSTDAVTATITDDYGLDSVYNYLWAPDSTPGVNDSIQIMDSVFTGTVTTCNASTNYTWPDSGDWDIVYIVWDDSGHTTRDSEQILIGVQAAQPGTTTNGVRIKDTKVKDTKVKG